MSRRYSPGHKQLVLTIFAVFFDVDVIATSKFTGVPERTIRDWFYAYMDSLKREQAAAAVTSPVPAEAIAQNAKTPQRR